MHLPSQPSLYYEKVASDHDETESEPLSGAASTARTNARLQHQLQVVSCCATYALVGPALVLVNARILNELHFPFPLFLSALGQLVTSAYCASVIHLLPRLQRLWLRWAPPRIAATVTPRSSIEPVPLASPKSPGAVDAGGGGGFGSITLHFWLWNMIPIGAAQGITFASTNAAYMYLTITFTQMLAAFTPTVTLVLLYATGVEIPTSRATICVCMIGIGCALASYGEGQLSLIGMAFRSAGIFAEATRLVLLQRLLKNLKLGVLESQYFFAPAAATFLLAGAFFTEATQFRERDGLATMRANPLLFTASSLLGVVASMLTFIVIKLTNSVTLKVINTARNAAFVLYTVLIKGEPATGIQVVGYSISLAAFSMYMYVKYHKL